MNRFRDALIALMGGDAGMADEFLAALAANPEALLAWVREAVPGAVVFVDGPELRERLATLLNVLSADATTSYLSDAEAVIAALTSGGAT